LPTDVLGNGLMFGYLFLIKLVARFYLLIFINNLSLIDNNKKIDLDQNTT